MKKSILVIGLGRFGLNIANKFLENGHEVMAIDCSEERADRASDSIRRILIGDATDEHFMKSVGVEDFDIAVVATGREFSVILEITVLLKDLGCKFIIARADSDAHKRLLERNGADYVSYAEREIADRLAVIFADDNVFDFVELTPDIGIYEVSVPRSWVGKSIFDLHIRREYGVSVLATKEDGRIIGMPDADYSFTGSERMLVMGTMDAVEGLNR